MNQNSGYGAALLHAIHSRVATPGRIFIVASSSDYADENYQKLQEVFRPDPNGPVSSVGTKIRFFTSISDANDALQTNNDDCVVLTGHTAHSVTTMLTVSKSRVHYFGIDWLLGIRRRYGQGSKISSAIATGATNIATVLNTGVRNSFHGIKFDSANTVAEGIYGFADAGEYTYMENCEIYKSTDLDVTGAAELCCNGDSSHYKDCYIGSTVDAISGAIIRPCVTFSRGLAATGAVARDVTFEGCIFARKCGNTANRFVYGAEANSIERLGLFKDCIFWAAKLSTAVPAQNVAFGATLTDGNILLKDCTSINAGTAMSTTTGVFVDSQVPAADTSGIALQCT